MVDMFFYFFFKITLIIEWIQGCTNILLFNIHSFLYFLDDVFFALADRLNLVWFIYEKFFFYTQNKSFNYYSRIMWKPSLNISDHIFNVPIFFVLQTMFLVIISVWARAVGPRMRMDQLSQFVWKDFVPSLTLILVVILIIMTF